MDDALYADTLVANCGHAALCGKPVQDGADSDPSFTFFYASDLGVCKKDGVLGDPAHGGGSGDHVVTLCVRAGSGSLALDG